MPKPSKDGPERIVHQGKIIEVVEQSMKIGDKKMNFEWARRSPGVRLIIIDKSKSKVLLTKEFRQEIDDYDYRLPGGKVVDTLEEYHQALADDKIDQLAEQKVLDEAREEAAVAVKHLKQVHVSKIGTTVVWDLHYFIVEKFEVLDNQDLETGEDISVGWYSFAEAKAMCLDGSIDEERSALILLRILEKE